MSIPISLITKKIEIEISEKEEELIEEAKEKLEMWLAEKRLKTEMGIVVPIDFLLF